MTASAWTKDHERVAVAYEKQFGEPLVAGWDWVRQIFDICAASVACDPSLDPDADLKAEIVDRTAAAIAIITYGVGRLTSV